MKTLPLTAAIAFAASLFVFQNAFALSVDTKANTNSDGSTKFSDPDDSIPFPHIGDDGRPTSNFQAQPVGNTEMSFGLTHSSSEPDTFQRAQQNRQQ